MAAVLLITCENESNVKPGFPDFFIKYYGDTGDQQGVDLVVNPDGTILLLGSSFDEEKGNRIYLTKVSEQGNILWVQYYGNGGQDFAVDIEPLNNGNFVVLGYRNVKVNDADVELLEIDPNGNLVPGKEKISGIPDENDIPRSVTPISDGGVLVIGQTTASTIDQGTGILDVLPNIFVQRYQSDFSLVSDFAELPFGRGGLDDGIKMIETSPNKFKMFFTSNTGNIGVIDNFNFIATELDNDGNPQGFVSFLDGVTNVTDEQLKKVAYSSTNGYALLGTTSPAGNATPSSAYLITLDPRLSLTNPLQITYTNQGNEIIAPLNLGGDISGSAVAITADNGYLVLANQSVTTSGAVNDNLVLFRLNFVGDVLWETSFGSEYSDFGCSVIELPDGKILIFGTVTLGNQQKMVLIKVNSQGQFAP